METRRSSEPGGALARSVLRMGWRMEWATRAVALGILGAAGALQAAASPAQDTPEESPEQARGPWLTLPDEPMGRPWASVAESTVPWDFLGSLESIPPDAEGEPWVSWADALGTVGDPSKAGKEGRRKAAAGLVRFAALDGRPEDAFAWAKTLGAGDPEGVAGTLPYLFPGVPFGARLGPGGKPAPLPAGTLLTPMLAAPNAPGAPMGIPWREAMARGLEVGDATFDMELKIDNTGVVVDFESVKGSETQVRLKLPAPDGYRLKALFIDWEKIPLPEGADPLTFDWAKDPIEVTVKERDSTYSVFARIAPLTSSLPTSPKAGQGLPRALLEGGLEVRVAPDSPEPWDAICRAWSKATGVAAHVVRAAPQKKPGQAAVSRGVRGTVLHFTSCPDPARLRRQITSAIEARIRSGS